MAIAVRHQHIIPVAMDQAWQVFNTQLVDLSPWLPHVARISLLKEQPLSERRMALDYAWHVEEQVIPGVAKPFLRDHLDQLHSATLWHHDQHLVEFRFYLDSVTGLLDCEGCFRMTEHSDGTCMDVQGDIQIHPHKLPGVPALVGRTIRPTVERVVDDALRPALSALPGALHQLIERQRVAS